MGVDNLLVVGTSHIAKQSLEEVEATIRSEHPDIIALELDPNRLQALLAKKKTKVSLRDIRRVGVKGYLFVRLGAWAEKKLGETVGVAPGSEMLQAVKVARELHIPIALIDQDIEVTLRRFSRALTWKEKWRFFVDICKAVILRRPVVTFDLTRVPSQKVIEKLTREVRKRYPNVYKVLVEERNEVMARRLAIMLRREEGKKILAVVGAGHQKEMLVLVKKYLNAKG